MKQRPTTAKVMRTSFQDSNIFGYKANTDVTVQETAKSTSVYHVRILFWHAETLDSND